MERTSHRYNAITVPIRGLSEGRRNFDLKIPANSIPGIVPEYIDVVEISGQIIKVGQRYRISLDLHGTAHLICDRSLEEFDEPIEAHIDLEHVVDADLASRQAGKPVDTDDIHGLMPDATEIDVTDDVRQELAVALPMRRVAPQYRNMDLDEIYPGTKDVPETMDERWSALRKLK